MVVCQTPSRESKLICKLCFELDGVVFDAVVVHQCTNPHTGKQFTAYVCKNCRDKTKRQQSVR
jgi:hypothetical protein